jgi:uncharacterized membrane protein
VRDRFIELDLLRTLAIAMMVVYHTVYDLHVLYGFSVDPFSLPWILFARATAILFLLLVGMGFALRRRRYPDPVVWKRTLRHALIILGGAALVTGATYLFDPATYVRFGILHCIGVTVLLLPLLPKRPWIATAIGIVLIAVGIRIWGTSSTTALLLPLGIPPLHFITVDYFPLLPWSGVIVLGVALAQPLLARMHTTDNRTLNLLTLPGKHALLLYLVHQPILVGILTVSLS